MVPLPELLLASIGFDIIEFTGFCIDGYFLFAVFVLPLFAPPLPGNSPHVVAFASVASV